MRAATTLTGRAKDYRDMERDSYSLRERSEWRRLVADLAVESPRAFLVALRVVDSPSLAEEAVQEAYARMLERPVKAMARSEAVLYLFKTVRNTAINLSQSSHHRKRREEAHAMRTTNPPSTPPAHLVEQAEAASAARAAMGQLPVEEREAVSLCCEQDLTHHAAAEILGIPERTLSHRIEKGLAKLQQMLATQGYAALTPLAVGEGLRGLGIPPAPPGMAQAVRQALAETTQRSLRLVRATPKLKFAGSLKVVLAGTLAAGAGAVAWWASRSAPPAQPERQVERAPASTIQSAPAQDRNRLEIHRRWTFEKGPPSDIEVREGEWRWDGKEQMAATALPVLLLLAESVPHKPMLLRLKIGKAEQHYEWGCKWTDGDRTLPLRQWSKPLSGSDPAEKTAIMYLMGSFVFTYSFEGDLIGIDEYAGAHPARSIALSLQGLAVQEMELNTVNEREIPPELADPKALIARLGWPVADFEGGPLAPRLKP